MADTVESPEISLASVLEDLRSLRSDSNEILKELTGLIGKVVELRQAEKDAVPEPAPVRKSKDILHEARGVGFAPLHPLRLDNPLEKALREEWKGMLPENQDAVLAGPAVPVSTIPKHIDRRLVERGSAFAQPFPFGRMTARDRWVVAEFMQWLGTGVGLAFLRRAFCRAGGSVVYDDYKKEKT